MPENKPMTGYPSIDKPWLKYYSEDKRGFSLPDCTVYEYMIRANSNNLDATALEYFGTVITYRELISKIDQCARSFAALGVRQGDVVSFCNPTTPEIYFAFYALNKLGAIANLIDPRTNASRIEECIVNTKSKIVVYIDVAYPKIQGTLKRSGVQKAISVSAADSLPYHLKLGYQLKNRIPKDRRPPKGNQYLKWSSFLALGQNSVEPEVDKQKHSEDETKRITAIVYTSGTTGIPKGAVLTNKNVLAMVKQNICADIGWDKNDRFLGIMPPFIAYGLVCGFALPLCLGMRVTIIPKFEAEQFDTYIMKHRPNHIMGVPSYIERLMHSEKLYHADLCFLKTVIVGGDKMNPDAEVEVNRFLKAHNSKCRVIKGYGLTEMSSNAVFPRCDACNKIGSVGTPLIGNNLKIIDSETGTELGYHEVGEICLTGPTLIDGYWNNAEGISKIFFVLDGVRWLRTGDRGYMDEDGVVFFHDRVKRMIVRHDGFKVFPSKIEGVICQSDKVADCCAVGVEDDKHSQGEIPVVFAVLNPSGNSMESDVERELRLLCKQGLPEYSQPKSIHFVSEFPLTPVGKIDYHALEAIAKGGTTHA